MFKRKQHTDNDRSATGTAVADYEVTKSDDEWKEELPPDRYAVLRRAGHRAGLVGRAAPCRR